MGAIDDKNLCEHVFNRIDFLDASFVHHRLVLYSILFDHQLHLLWYDNCTLTSVYLQTESAGYGY